MVSLLNLVTLSMIDCTATSKESLKVANFERGSAYITLGMRLITVSLISIICSGEICFSLSSMLTFLLRMSSSGMKTEYEE
ncbi:hypothetical protein CICLE_v10023136mg [Citrus x clementina]|uniref:NADH:quinone oxidoreductase/Mrp antiporter membrane subunit domain-containing protein n=1 Tax=Citrus clementina TaxID=85681 RepID=V4TYX6_CITCL|nr:hypothetical protein CICLE_v10023136mg [Citrus x clementina]